MNLFEKLFKRKSKLSIQAAVDDSPGWASLSGRPHDYDPAQVQEIYLDALEAWRKNPIAWRIISITTDYTVGDRITVSSPVRRLNRFIQEFWNHPQNRMDQRLEGMSDELARAGDLFVLLFRNPQDGMSYLRFVTKDCISRIETAPNDWEKELAYYERPSIAAQEKAWLSPWHPEAPSAEAVMLHYAVNRPLGALLGESDLTTMLPWLLRYSRMLEDRVRLNWAVRAFLWMVTVPSHKVREKQEQYRNPPEAGSIIVKDESESWEVQAPSLHAMDAQRDLQAVRYMIDAGSGYPPHWRGEGGDANLATAQAMQGPTERHLLRRQQYLKWMLSDILYHAYQRAVQLGLRQPLLTGDYDELFVVSAPDISRWDNESLARASRDLAQGFLSAMEAIPRMPRRLAERYLRLLFKFAGEPAPEDILEEMLAELEKRKEQN